MHSLTGLVQCEVQTIGTVSRIWREDSMQIIGLCG